MSLSARDRNIIIVAVVAALVVGAAAFFVGRGCGGDDDADDGKTSKTVDTVTATTPARTATTATALPEPVPVPEPTPLVPEPAAVTLEIIDRSVSPEISNPGDTLTFTVLVQGVADRVVVSGERIAGGGIFDFEAAPAGTAGDITTWTFSTAATTLTGEYRYYARAFAPDGSVVEMPGVSGYTFLIEP